MSSSYRDFRLPIEQRVRDRAGDEVVQAYVHQEQAPFSRSTQTLQAFALHC